MEPKRPRVLVAVKLQVAMRQIDERGWCLRTQGLSATRALRIALRLLGLVKPHLDHDPALARRRRNKRTGKYTPDANDPRYMQWIEGGTDHLEKTAGRGGEKMRFGGDTREAAKTKRLERRRAGVKKKRKSRPFPKGRKLQSRGFIKRGN